MGSPGLPLPIWTPSGTGSDLEPVPRNLVTVMPRGLSFYSDAHKHGSTDRSGRRRKRKMKRRERVCLCREVLQHLASNFERQDVYALCSCLFL